MKHSVKITLLLLAMFFVTQLIGIAVISSYSPQTTQVTTESGEIINVTNYNLPYGLEPPKEINPKESLISILIAFGIAITLMLIMMRFRAEIFLRLWFFLVVSIALAVTLNAISLQFGLPTLLALTLALPLAFLKIFKRNIIVHNLTELAIYPGIAAIFVPLLSIWTVVLLLILISLYDMYAVWHSGFMQKMAKFQIQKLRIFSGFFVPYLGKHQKQKLSKLSKSKLKDKKIRISVAILGGGDVVFPIILAGVVLRQLGFVQAIIIALGASIALAGLLFLSEKGKFYPAMPFITTGCFIALAFSYLL